MSEEEVPEIMAEYFAAAVGSDKFGQLALKWGEAVSLLTCNMDPPMPEFPNPAVLATLPERAQDYVERRLADELSLASYVVAAAGLLVSDSVGNKVSQEDVEVRLTNFVRQLRAMVGAAQTNGVLVKVERGGPN